MLNTSENLVLYAVIAACFLYLVAMYILQRVKTARMEKYVAQAKHDYEEARKQQSENRQKLVDVVEKSYGSAYAQMVSSGKLWVGMPTHLLMISKGKANNIKQSVDTNAITQIWQYADYDMRTGAHKPKTEIVLRNNEVVSWEDFA